MFLSDRLLLVVDLLDLRIFFTVLKKYAHDIKSTRVHVGDLYRIRPLLDLKTSVLLANAFVSSRLDCCNSLSLSLTDFELRRLQLVQTLLCRVVIRPSRFSYIAPRLGELHWLPVGYGVQLKIGLITYKILNQGQPVYLRELIHPYTSSRNKVKKITWNNLVHFFLAEEYFKYFQSKNLGPSYF